MARIIEYILILVIGLILTGIVYKMKEKEYKVLCYDYSLEIMNKIEEIYDFISKQSGNVYIKIDMPNIYYKIYKEGKYLIFENKECDVKVKKILDINLSKNMFIGKNVLYLVKEGNKIYITDKEPILNQTLGELSCEDLGLKTCSWGCAEECCNDKECEGKIKCIGGNIKCKNGKCICECPKGKVWNGTHCIKEEIKIKILFVPFNWKGSYNSFKTFAKQQADFFISRYPVRDCPHIVKIEYFPHICNIYLSCDASDLNKIRKCIASYGYNPDDYDFIVALTDQDICGMAAGWSDGAGGTNVVICEAQYKIVMAHELGHEFGLNDEYVDACRCKYGLVNPHANCLDPKYHGDDPAPGWTKDYCGGGTKCPNTYTVTCLGNMNSYGGRDIMSYVNAPGPRYFAPPAWNYLKNHPKLKCP